MPFVAATTTLITSVDCALAPLWNPVRLAEDIAFVDTVAKHGHMLELYEPVDSLTGFYDFVAKKAGKFEKGVIVDISLG